MSLNDLAITITAENQAGAEFQNVANDASAMGASVEDSAGNFESLTQSSQSAAMSLAKTATMLSAVTSAGSAIISLSTNMGILDQQTANYARTAVYGITALAALVRLKDSFTFSTNANTASVAANSAAQSVNASQSVFSAAAYKVKAAATWIATTAQNALNVSYATFLALTGVGIAVIAAAAVAMMSFANSMNSATASVKNFNDTSARTPGHMRNIQRAGESELYRRGIE